MAISQEEAVMLTLIGAQNKASFCQEWKNTSVCTYRLIFINFISNIISTMHQYTEKFSFPLCIELLSAIDVICQARETVFHRDIETPRRELKIRRAVECTFEEIGGG